MRFPFLSQLPPPPELEDILPPLPPESLWERALDAYEWWWFPLILALVMFGVAIGWFLKKTAPAPIPPAPREMAIGRLRSLADQAADTPSYAFSFMVSDILRSYVLEEYRIPATRQTSVEFLQSVRGNPIFTTKEAELLDRFLDQCDRIKFAGDTAEPAENDPLLEMSLALVERKIPATLLDAPER